MADIKVALRSDSGSYLARCNQCYSDAAYPDSAFVHVAADKLSESPWAIFVLEKLENGKYAFKADSGNYLARCNNCVPGAAYPDSAFIHVSPSELAGSAYAQFTLSRLGNGKYALQADSGNFLSRCNNCAPGEAYPDSAFIHVTPSELESAPWAQWDMIIIP